MDLKEMKKKGHSLEPIMRIGKNGITDTIVEELKKHLKKRKLIKVKLLRSCLDSIPKNDAFEKIIHETGATLVDKTGFVIVLAKR